MTILEAGLKSSVYTAAQEYLESGVSIIPLKGKICALKSWSMAQQYRASEKVLTQWSVAGLLSGVGVVCGAVSGNLVVLDFDSHEAVNEFELVFPDLQDTYIVSSGSRRGAHYYFYSKELPSSMLVRNYELRANGMYVVAPPSLHPSGNHYEVSMHREPMRLDNMREVVRWVKSKRPRQMEQPKQMSALAAPHTGGPLSREEYFKRRYVESALNQQVHYVTVASEGNRNNQLYWSAHALGQIVAVDALPRFRVETELLYAAIQAGLPDLEAAATIKSGLDTGAQRPRQIPPPPAPRK